MCCLIIGAIFRLCLESSKVATEPEIEMTQSCNRQLMLFANWELFQINHLLIAFASTCCLGFSKNGHWGLLASRRSKRLLQGFWWPRLDISKYHIYRIQLFQPVAKGRLIQEQ